MPLSFGTVIKYLQRLFFTFRNWKERVGGKTSCDHGKPLVTAQFKGKVPINTCH
jgi:hypothetical protein